MNKYPEYIMKDLRRRSGRDSSDTSRDEFFNSLPQNTVFKEVVSWNNLPGWDSTLKGWVKCIYGVDLDQVCKDTQIKEGKCKGHDMSEYK